MIRRPPRSTRTDTLFPYTTLFRSVREADLASERPLPALLPLQPHRSGDAIGVPQSEARIAFRKGSDLPACSQDLEGFRRNGPNIAIVELMSVHSGRSSAPETTSRLPRGGRRLRAQPTEPIAVAIGRQGHAWH